jgi:hypothetical protein
VVLPTPQSPADVARGDVDLRRGDRRREDLRHENRRGAERTPQASHVSLRLSTRGHLKTSCSQQEALVGPTRRDLRRLGTREPPREYAVQHRPLDRHGEIADQRLVRLQSLVDHQFLRQGDQHHSRSRAVAEQREQMPRRAADGAARNHGRQVARSTQQRERMTRRRAIDDDEIVGVTTEQPRGCNPAEQPLQHEELRHSGGGGRERVERGAGQQTPRQRRHAQELIEVVFDQPSRLDPHARHARRQARRLRAQWARAEQEREAPVGGGFHDQNSSPTLRCAARERGGYRGLADTTFADDEAEL